MSTKQEALNALHLFDSLIDHVLCEMSGKQEALNALLRKARELARLLEHAIEISDAKGERELRKRLARNMAKHTRLLRKIS